VLVELEMFGRSLLSTKPRTLHHSYKTNNKTNPDGDERAFRVLPVEEVDAFLVAISERD
jgi:hypothetical protein